ncbi:MAG: CHASE3 domain-containing protein, partial [Nostoc sp.]
SHTLGVMDRLESLVSTLKDAETGQRGYLLTGNESYLEPYANARAAAPGELAALRKMLSDNPTQIERLDNVERLSADKFAELAETIALRRAGSAEAALAVVRTDRG